NERDISLIISVNDEATMEVSIPNCVNAINTASAMIAYFAKPARILIAGPLNKFTNIFSIILAMISAMPKIMTAANTFGKYAVIAEAISTKKSSLIKYNACTVRKKMTNTCTMYPTIVEGVIVSLSIFLLPICILAVILLKPVLAKKLPTISPKNFPAQMPINTIATAIKIFGIISIT